MIDNNTYKEVTMSQPQMAIAPDANRFAKFAVLKINQEAGQVLAALKNLPHLVEQVNQDEPGAALVSSISFSHSFWKQLNQAMPAELEPFEPLGSGDIQAPATDADVMIHLHSLRPDLHFYVLRKLISEVAQWVTIVDETDAFRYLDQRDFTGFEDGTENPKELERQEVAVIAEGEFAGGSYMLWQRYEHKLPAWERLSIAQQEKVIGRTKPDSIELDDVPARSHVGRVDLKEDGKGLKMVRHSLPYGQVGAAHGLLFAAYCNRLYNFKQLLASMYGHLDNQQDILLRFTDAVTGGYFFAPSEEMLAQLDIA